MEKERAEKRDVNTLLESLDQILESKKACILRMTLLSAVRRASSILTPSASPFVPPLPAEIATLRPTIPRTPFAAPRLTERRDEMLNLNIDSLQYRNLANQHRKRIAPILDEDHCRPHATSHA